MHIRKSLMNFLLQNVVEKLGMVLEDASLYEQGDWIIGNAILTVCRNILYVHNTKSVTVGKNLRIYL